MKIIETEFDGLYIIEPIIFEDERGYFYETYNEQRYKNAGIDYKFVQDNESKSSYGIIRGLHFQKGEFAQAKLVRCLQGKVLDVVVDMRKNSKTFGKHYSVELTGENKLQFMIPRGFAHGFSVLSDTAIFSYKCDNIYNKESEGGIIYNDPFLNIDWKIKSGSEILSEKDKKHPTFKEFFK